MPDPTPQMPKRLYVQPEADTESFYHQASKDAKDFLDECEKGDGPVELYEYQLVRRVHVTRKQIFCVTPIK